MNKKISMLAFFGTFLFFSATVFSADTKDKELQEEEWKLHSIDGDYVGLLKKEDNRFIIHDKNEITLKKQKKKVWEMYNQANYFLGTVEEYKPSVFKMYDKNKKYLGLILSDDSFRPYGASKSFGKGYRVVRINSETMKLYLYCLDAIKKINKR